MNLKYQVEKTLLSCLLAYVVGDYKRLVVGVSFAKMVLISVLLLSSLVLIPVEVFAAITVRVQTSLGNFDIELYDEAAPLTVANFMNYVDRAAFDNSFIHRSKPGFIVQGGGYYIDNQSVLKVPVDSPVVNEFSFDRSNLRGSVAMAKVAGNPDSATSGWFVNLGNNTANLDSQNDGFTVFGQISIAGMMIVDAVAALEVVNAGGVFSDLPLLKSFNGSDLYLSDLVMVQSISVVQPKLEQDASDRVFDYLETCYPQFISPPGGSSLSADGYYFRYYADNDAYVGIAAGTVYYFGPATENKIVALGSLAEWVDLAAVAD